jgi:2-polyprenyl-6-hydroxyphenyl methylase/3-demethylubiquinone-9 3-methyltransferase
MATQQDAYYNEVSQGKRFKFGRNWTRFLRVLNDERITIAENSLKSMLKVASLTGISFLDVGSGSGLFSLAARRCGAKVHSFDYDPESVACTLELKRRYFPGDSAWTVEQGSVLDLAYLNMLGTFDIVYSWGVLHHTGRMWQALNNVKPIVRMGGQLFIAIYNDQGEVTDHWAKVKTRFNSLPIPLAALYALKIITTEERKSFVGRGIKAWLKSWSEYGKQSSRGMSKWHDWIDWIGGQPYERASIEQITDHFANDGFRLTNLVDCSNGYGCNEFVFSREAPLGVLVESPIPGGTSMLRRYGRRVMPPFELTTAGWLGRVPTPLKMADVGALLLFSDGVLVGPTSLAGSDRVVVGAPQERAETIKTGKFQVVSAVLRKPQMAFEKVRGHMWKWEAGDLEAGADDMDYPCRSTIFMFEKGRQLPFPHALHDDIARIGKGRFSHWGRQIYFAPVSVTDPNADRDQFAVVVPLDRA